MVTERSQRLSEQLRRRPEIPIALVVLVALLIGVLWRSRDDNSADAALRVDSPPATATTGVVPTFTYVVSPLLTTTTTTTTLPPATTVYQPSLTTFPIGGTYPTTTPVTYQPTTTRYVPVTTYPRPTVTTARPTTTVAVTTSSTSSTSSTVATTTATTTSTTTSTTTTTVPAGRPTVLVIGTDATPAETDRRVKLIAKLYQSGYNPIGIVNAVASSNAGYSTTGPGGPTVALTDALVAAEPDAKWDKITWSVVPNSPPWTTDWATYKYTLAITLSGPYPPVATTTTVKP